MTPLREKQTKIIATLSDETSQPKVVRELWDHGMDLERLNTAHPNESRTVQKIKNIRQVNNLIGIILDNTKK